MPPTFGNGKICYIEIPAVDVPRSAEFYSKVFGWNIRKRGDGSTSFDDGVGQVSGVWTVGRKTHSGESLNMYIMVDDADATLAAIAVNGGEIVQPVNPESREVTALFRDPCGNVFGIYQHSGK